jgi:hypothetical protein
MIECKVHSRVEEMHGKRVLVFLRPRASKTDYLVHPWQTLEISAAATACFQFDDTVSARILTTNGSGNQTWSAPHVAHPGHMLLAERHERLSPKLSRAPAGMAKRRLTSDQAGVFNQTVPYTTVDCVWQVGGQPVVTMPRLDWGMTCTFEYDPVLYFMVATPMYAGENFALQAFTDMTACPLDQGIAVLDVEICRTHSRWCFNFRSDLDE